MEHRRPTTTPTARRSTAHSIITESTTACIGADWHRSLHQRVQHPRVLCAMKHSSVLCVIKHSSVLWVTSTLECSSDEAPLECFSRRARQSASSIYMGVNVTV